MKSKTKIKKQIGKKTSEELISTILIASKNKKWIKVAEILSGPRRKKVNISLGELNKDAKSGEKVLIPGKVLSQGKIDKKIKVIAIGFSEKAKDKLLKAGCEVFSMIEEIKKNPEMKGVKIFKKNENHRR